MQSKETKAGIYSSWHIFELIKTIASSQGLRGFWKENFLNILRTAPFKAVNFLCS